MNANGQRFWQLRDRAHWTWAADEHGIHVDPARGTLRLRSQRAAPAPVAGAPDAAALIAAVPMAMDAHGTRAFWHAASHELRATGAGPGSVRIDTYDDQGVLRSVLDADDPGDPPLVLTDLLMGHDGVLYIAAGDRVILLDRRGRWLPARVSIPGFTPWRLAPAQGGGVWVVERDDGQGGQASGRLARVSGLPLPVRALPARDADAFRLAQENPRPPVMRLVVAATLPAGEAAVAMAGGLFDASPDAPGGCSTSEPASDAADGPGGGLALLTHTADGAAWLRLLEAPADASGNAPAWGAPVRLLGADHGFSLAWSRRDRVVVLVPGHTEAFAYPVAEDAGEVLPAGDIHPLPGYTADGPFVHTLGVPPYYPTLGSTAEPDNELQPLRTLSLPSYAPAGEAQNARRLDAGSRGVVWDRLYVEGVFPPGCGAVISLAATDEPAPPGDADGAWHDHVVGAPASMAQATATAAGQGADIPRAAWLATPTELPFHPGLLACTPGCAPERDRAGCFTVLVQRNDRAVRALRGRYLWVRVRLEGNRRTTPEIAAIRAYAARFSYRDQYLPELYHETLFGPDADAGAPATGPDFLERFLALFESVLTPLEDRAAHGWLLTHPATAPANALDWLASWLGLTLDAATPEHLRRAILAHAAELARWRGTLRGLGLALDLATGGAVRDRAIVVVEDFRLRRTFATILGVDFGAVDDPLLAGPVFHGNSMLGDTMFFGNEREREFLALFGADLALSRQDARAVRAFFDDLAHRVTVLVHERAAAHHLDLGVVRRVVEREVPAHLRHRVLTASHPLLVGVSSLVGVDTYLVSSSPSLARGAAPSSVPFLASFPAPGAARDAFQANASRVGGKDLLQSPGSLDPRLEGGV